MSIFMKLLTTVTEYSILLCLSVWAFYLQDLGDPWDQLAWQYLCKGIRGAQVHQVFTDVKEEKVLVVPVARMGFQAPKDRKVFWTKMLSTTYVKSIIRNCIQNQLLKPKGYVSKYTGKFFVFKYLS